MSATLNLIRWAGGKGHQLRNLLPIIPDSHVYCEPFGGGASVLLNRPRQQVEVYNDLDSSLVNLFSVVRDDQLFDRFASMVGWTLYSRQEFEKSTQHEQEQDPVVKAAMFYTALNQSFSGKRLALPSEWSRSAVDNVATRFVLRQEKLGAIHDRLRHVQIECRDALDILQEWDGVDTCFYCDPPYVLDTRKKTKYYAHETTDEYHRELVSALKGVRGAVILSGYNHPLYTPLLDVGWRADSYKATASMNANKSRNSAAGRSADKPERQEVVWRNRQAVESGLRIPFPEMWDGIVDREASEGDSRLIPAQSQPVDVKVGTSHPDYPEIF